MRGMIRNIHCKMQICFIHFFLFTTVQIPTMKSVNNFVDVVIPKKPIQQRSNTSSPADFLVNRSPGSSLGNTSGLNTPQMAGTVLPPSQLPLPPDLDLYQGAVLSPPGSRYVFQPMVEMKSGGFPSKDLAICSFMYVLTRHSLSYGEDAVMLFVLGKYVTQNL